jgi:hypothetical protein
MDGEAFADQLFEATSAHIEKALAPLLAEITALKAANEDLAARVARAEARPEPQAGESGKDGAPASDEQVAKAVADYLAANPPQKGADGKDGVGLAGAMIDREGALVVTLSDGKAVPLGSVVGKDGEAGKAGLGFRDMDIERPDERTLRFKFARDDQEEVYDIHLEHPIYRGVFKAGEVYGLGDAVTWAGSLWICGADATTDKPGEGSDAWQLAVKKGRDGKDGSSK